MARQVNYCHAVANLEGWAEEFAVMDGKTEHQRFLKEELV